MKKLYRTTLFAGVLAFGLSACGDDVQVVDPPDPPPPPPPTLTVSFSPQSVSVNEGQSADLGLNISGGDQGATASWSCTIGDSEVATASETGSGCQVTGVAEGSTTVSAEVTKGDQTASASAGVSVAELQRAEVSISSINQNDEPADISNIAGQLDVVINMDPGDESPTQLDLLVDGEVVASQMFSAEEIAAIVEAAAEAEDPAEQVQQITLSFNTARYEIEDGEANIWHLNGDHEISAELQVSQQTTEPRASNIIEVVFNNDDGFHVIGTRPTNSAMDDGGLRWFGGPDSGDTEALTIPVIYSVFEGEQRSLQSVTADFCNDGASTIESADSPYAFAWECAGYEGPSAGEEPTISSQYAPDGDTGPDGGDVLNEDEDDYRFPVRIDNLEPQGTGTPVFTIVRQTGLDNVGNWLNDQYAFANGFRDANVADGGVGRADAEWYFVTDAAGDETLVGPEEDLTGAGIADALGADAETVTNEEYAAWAQVCDLLGNCNDFRQEELEDPDHPDDTFGYDETSPDLEFLTDDMGVFENDQVIVDNFTGGTDIISLEGSDVASGFAPIGGGLSFNRAVVAVGSTFDDPENPTVGTLVGDPGVDDEDQATLPFTTLSDGGAVTGLTDLATPVLADENHSLTGNISIEYTFDFGNWLENVVGPTDPSYYIYQVQLRDRAGNLTRGDRAAYHNNGASPEIEAITRSGTFPADPAYQVTFTQDPLELFEGSLALDYVALDQSDPLLSGSLVWERPSAEISSVLRLDAGIEDGVAFNDYIQRPHRDLMLDLGFADHGLAFIKNIQATDGAGVPQAGQATDDAKPNATEAQVYNGLALMEESDIVHSDTPVAGQSPLVTVAIPNEEVPDSTVDYQADTNISGWGIAEDGVDGCEAAFCAQLYGPTGTLELPFERDGVLILWADAAAPTEWRVLEVATPNFSGSFPTRDDGVERIYEWEFDGTVEGFDGDVEFRALGVNSSGDGLLSAGVTFTPPVPPEFRIVAVNPGPDQSGDPAPGPLDPVSIVPGGSQEFTVRVEVSNDEGATWVPFESEEDIDFSFADLDGSFNTFPPTVTTENVGGTASITFSAGAASGPGTITGTWTAQGASVTWDVTIQP